MMNRMIRVLVCCMGISGITVPAFSMQKPQRSDKASFASLAFPALTGLIGLTTGLFFGYMYGKTHKKVEVFGDNIVTDTLNIAKEELVSPNSEPCEDCSAKDIEIKSLAQQNYELGNKVADLAQLVEAQQASSEFASKDLNELIESMNEKNTTKLNNLQKTVSFFNDLITMGVYTQPQEETAVTNYKDKSVLTWLLEQHGLQGTYKFKNVKVQQKLPTGNQATGIKLVKIVKV